jgi:PIN domain nuclease of toxin-antitoxin system
MNGQSMSPDSRESIKAASADNTGVFVSPISAWELATLVGRNRIRLAITPAAWFDALLRLPAVRLAPMPPNVLIDSVSLPGSPPKDPADRIIAATARAYGYAVITRDGELTHYARAGHIRLIAC